MEGKEKRREGRKEGRKERGRERKGGNEGWGVRGEKVKRKDLYHEKYDLGEK